MEHSFFPLAVLRIFSVLFIVSNLVTIGLSVIFVMFNLLLVCEFSWVCVYISNQILKILSHCPFKYFCAPPPPSLDLFLDANYIFVRLFGIVLLITEALFILSHFSFCVFLCCFYHLILKFTIFSLCCI